MAGPKNRRSSSSVRPCLNVFSILDHMTGNYLRGKDGAWYLNGGLSHITGYAGRGNTFKTAFSTYNFITTYARYNLEYAEIYDTEMSFKIDRVNTFAQLVPEARNIDFAERIRDDENRSFNIVSSVELLGDQWWKELRDVMEERKNTKPKDMRVTPFLDFNGEFKAIPNPWGFNVDSLTMLRTQNVETMHDKNSVGDSGLNTEAMKGAAAKSQLMAQMPIISGAAYYYIGMVAHAGDEIKMDQYAPSHKKLAGLKGDLKLKGVPENFSFLTNNCFIAVKTQPLLDSKKLPEYPLAGVPEQVGDTDLVRVTFDQLRGKAGPTGKSIDLIFSQSEGLLVPITEFFFCNKLLNGYGMEVKGNNAGFRLDLYPDVYFTRKNIRQLTKEDPKFCRALAITAALGYMSHNYYNVGDVMVTPKELYDGLKERGYDWDEILSDTVEYWYFNDQAEEIGKPTLTAMTMLQMNAGNYVAKFLKTHPDTTK